MIDLSTAKDPPAARECPYCLSYGDFNPVSGMTLLFLKGHDAGYRGTVSEPAPTGYRADEFLVRMEYEKRPSVLRIVSPKRDNYLLESRFEVPTWMPNLSIDDNASLHDALMNSIRGPFLADDRNSLAANFHELIRCCWWKRYPVAGRDLWPMLEAHGVQPSLRDETIKFFDFGLDLLRQAQGRSAVKKKCMPSMSQGRYLTKRHRELNIQFFGHP